MLLVKDTALCFFCEVGMDSTWDGSGVRGEGARHQPSATLHLGLYFTCSVKLCGP